MDPTDLSDAQLDQLADQLAGRLPTGTHGDRVILPRRAFTAAVGGTLGASGLVALGVDPAAAQAAGQVGTSSDPVDAFVFDLDVQNGATFNGTDLTGVGSLSTDEGTIAAKDQSKDTVTVGTSDVEVYNGEIDDLSRVVVQFSSGSSEQFIDLILTGRESYNRYAQLARASAPNRSYSIIGDGNLDMSVDSGEFDVDVYATQFDQL